MTIKNPQGEIVSDVRENTSFIAPDEEAAIDLYRKYVLPKISNWVPGSEELHARPLTDEEEAELEKGIVPEF